MKQFKVNKLGLLVSAAALALAGCGGGDVSAPGVSAPGANYDVSIKADSTGTPFAQVAGTVATLAAATGTDTWQTPAAKVIGVTLIAQLDSSGPDVWDPVKHPVVYMTTNGPGYQGTISPTQTAPGIAIIDANSYEAVASAIYKAAGVIEGSYSEPHGLGVSADGKWIYLQGVMPSSVSDLAGGAVVLVVNARTLKIDKIIKSRAHHIRLIYDANTKKDLVLVDAWGDFYAMDPNDNHKVVGSVNPANLNGAGYIAHGDPSGQYLFITTRTGFLESEGGVAIVSLKDWLVKRRINTLDASPIWTTFSADNKTAYVSGGENSTVARIDKSSSLLSDWKVTGIANAGGIGPYGVTLNWDDKRLIAISKGEASHNMGMTAGIIDTSRFVDPALYRGWTTVQGAIYTGCVRGDHMLMHPDPSKNEGWISCNSSFNNVVVSFGDSSATNPSSLFGGSTGGVAVKKTVPNPNGGSSHNGAFVVYNVNGSPWAGEVQSDTNGLRAGGAANKLAVQAGTLKVGK